MIQLIAAVFVKQNLRELISKLWKICLLILRIRMGKFVEFECNKETSLEHLGAHSPNRDSIPWMVSRAHPALFLPDALASTHR